jgi:site-specific DNA recombinase
MSTAEQAEKGWSIEGQYWDIRAFCEKQDEWKVRHVFKDEGYSAASLDRPGVLKLPDRVQEGDPDVVVVWEFDDLSLDNVDFPVLLQLLQ